jgi:AcrR family transcriptional regulator
VSVASVFRYFDGLADLQLQTYERFKERFASLIAVSAAAADAPFDERVARLVRARLDLYEQAGAIMIVGRLRALEHEPLVAASAGMRGMLADQTRALLRADTDGTGPARAAELVAVVDAFTSLESWDVMRRTHGRTRAQIAAAWQRGIAALVADWHSSDGGAS